MTAENLFNVTFVMNESTFLPTLLSVQGDHISLQSSSGSSVPLQLGLPAAVPPQYSGLKEVSIEAVRARLRLLYHFSDLMYSSWRLLNLSPNNQVGNDYNKNKRHLYRKCLEIW